VAGPSRTDIIARTANVEGGIAEEVHIIVCKGLFSELVIAMEDLTASSLEC
jgi:hypothetical protein